MLTGGQSGQHMRAKIHKKYRIQDTNTNVNANTGYRKQMQIQIQDTNTDKNETEKIKFQALGRAITGIHATKSIKEIQIKDENTNSQE